MKTAKSDTSKYRGALVIGQGHIEDEQKRYLGTCLFVEMRDGKRGGIWYDAATHELEFIPERRAP